MSRAILREFGERVRALRQRKKLSQEKLALQAELERSYVGQVERGETNISLLNIEKIANGLGVRVRDLFRN